MKALRHRVATASLGLALLCVVLALVRMPRHGLLLTRFAAENFTHPVGEPVVDAKLHFSSGDALHPVPAWLKPHSSARWTGYIDIPREAVYSIGLTSDDGAWLYVDDTPQVSLPGVHGPWQKSKDIRLPQGYHKIRIDYFQGDRDATMELRWHRSGNNATLDKVPVSMLYPSEPAPVSLVDRSLRLAPWLLLALVLWLYRARAFPEHLLPIRRTVYLSAFLVFLFALVVRLNGLLAEGETCDQWTYVSAGYVYAQNIAAGITDADQWAWNSEHPAIGKLIYGAVQFVFGTETWHSNATAAVLGALTVLTIFWVGARLFNLETGIASGIVLALVPPLVAHNRVAGLDTPSTFFFTLAMAFLIRAIHEPRSREWSFGAMVLAAGLAFGTKFSNGLLVPVMGVAIPAMYWQNWREKRWPKIPWTLYGFPFTLLIPTVITWPWLWTSPIEHYQATHTHWGYSPPDVFFGVVAPPPATYFFVAFLYMVPVALFVPFLVALAQVFRRKAQSALAPLPAGSPYSARAWWVLLICWFLIPFAWTLMNWRMNNVRYVLNIFPPFALLTGAGVVILAGLLRENARRIAVAALVGTTLLYLVVVDVRIHPYYLDYFNEASGGTKNVMEHRTFDTGWWGEGIDPAIKWLNEHAPANATYSLDAFSPPGVILTRPDLHEAQHATPDFIVSQIFNFHTVGVGYRQVYTVTAGGAPIVKVFARPSVVPQMKLEVASPQP